MREADNKKRMLEESADALREECAKLKAAEQVKNKKQIIFQKKCLVF